MTTDNTICHECGAALPADGDCRGRLYALLELETRVLAGLAPEDAKRAHFFAVATYQLQHPSRLTLPVLNHLRAGVSEMLAPHARPIEAMRRDVARVTNGPQRVMRRAPEGDRSHVPHWPRQWSLTVVDVLAGPEDAYPAEVARWASETLSDLERAETT